jgi:hypothetical protein
MAKAYRHEVKIPRISIGSDGSRVPISGVYNPPVGTGRVLRGGVASITNQLPNPVYDPSANIDAGITYHIGALPYVTNESEGEQ